MVFSAQVHINSVHYNMKVYNCDLCKFCTIQKGNLRYVKIKLV